MLLSLQLSIFFLSVSTHFQTISCECRQSFMTICDTFEDFENYNDTENLNEVIIGSDSGLTKMTSVRFMEMLKLDKYQLTSLIIIKAINRLEKTISFECLYLTSSLKYFSLYGNELKVIERYHFPLMPLKKFSLVNNKIERIKSEAFKHHEIEDLDLSDNFLETIELRALPTTSSAKIITIRNNRLTHIAPGSFPSSLESLNLDKNNLRYLQEGVFGNLEKLQQLILSNNKFAEMPPIKHLKNLIVFDISRNEINVVDKWTFKEMNGLKLIDLSHNKVTSHYILHWLDVPGKQPQLTVNLALNRLKNLDLKNLSFQNKTFILYGNPWNCSSWIDLKQGLKGHESHCDLEFLADDQSPYCISYDPGVYPFRGMWDTDIDGYHDRVKMNKKVSQCALGMKKYELLYRMDFFCTFIRDNN